MKNRVSKGDIWLIDFNPIVGQEQAGIRPAAVVSGNSMNQYFSLVMVCPLSTKIKNFEGNIVIDPSVQNGLTETSEILTFQIRSVSKNRMVKKLGAISEIQTDKIVQSVVDRMTY